MRKFELNGVKLQIPEDCLTEPLIQAIEQGRYEGQEAIALKKNLRTGDKLMDLGAGAGYLSALAAEIIGPENVVAVEAGPKMMKPLRTNLDNNFAAAAYVVHGAVVADNFPDATIQFRSKQAFWASEITADGDAASDRVSAVPALKITGLLDQHKPSVVLMDIEGAEVQLANTEWPDHVRMLIMELHFGKYSAGDVQQIFDGLSRCGLNYFPWGSRGELVVFARL